MNKKFEYCLVTYANTVAATVQYENWSDKFCREELRRVNEEITTIMKDKIDWKHLSKDEAEDLGFYHFEDDLYNLYLIPLWLLSLLPIGTKLTSINGRELIYDGKNINKDIRFGCLAYGIIIKED